jgi:nucleotide-binding universal stress UspA family protein
MSALANRHGVVAGVDGSPMSIDAACWAADLAVRLGAPLLLARTLDAPSTDWFTDPARHRDPELPTAARATAAAMLDRTRQLLESRCPTVRVTTEIHIGVAEWTLIKLSDRADFVVLGAAGHGVSRTPMFGSPPLRVIDHAPCPVVVRRDCAPPQPTHRGPVLAYIDGSERGNRALGWAFEMGLLLGVPVLALAAETHTENRSGHPTAQLIEWWEEKYPEVEVYEVLERSAVAAALHTPRTRAQLLVLGDHAHEITAPFDSTIRAVLRDTAIPLMVCRRGR